MGRLVESFGFKPDEGYDRRGPTFLRSGREKLRDDTFLRGSMPAARVRSLLKDLRYEPSGWFWTDAPTEFMAEPFASVVPIRLVQVFGPAAVAPAPLSIPAVPVDRPSFAKLTPDLRGPVLDGTVKLPVRVEIVLVATPPEGDAAWRDPLRDAAGGIALEGRAGPIVTASVEAAADLGRLAQLPSVVSIRLPRQPLARAADPAKEPKHPKDGPLPKSTAGELRLPTATPDHPEDDGVKYMRLDRLHAVRGADGHGVKVVVIDTDFAGYDDFLPKELAAPKGSKLPPRKTLIDLTAERNRGVTPERASRAAGHGTELAKVVQAAAPAAEILLVRIAPDASYQLVNVARAVKGEGFTTEALRTRNRELLDDFATLRLDRQRAEREYRSAFEDFDAAPPAIDRRKAAQAKLAELDARQEALIQRNARITQLERDLKGLEGARIVLSGLGWRTGYAFDAASPLSRYFEQTLARPAIAGGIRKLTVPAPAAPPLWFFAAGDTPIQSWTGAFRDADGNGVMEFAPPDARPLPERWSKELNFLGLAGGKETVADLPAGAVLRLSLQWREPHDPSLPEGDYREPIAPLRLSLVRQKDPSGTSAPSDEIDTVVRSDAVPERLYNEPNYGIYEQLLEVKIPEAGRYALRIEGMVPRATRPGVVLKDLVTDWELRPRLFVEATDAATLAKGRIVLLDYSSDVGVAVPGDARTVVSVGALGASYRGGDEIDREALKRAFGDPNADAGLGAKPDLVAPWKLVELGDASGPAGRTSVAAALAAGAAASLISGGLPAQGFPGTLRLEPGAIFRVPESWLGRRR